MTNIHIHIDVPWWSFGMHADGMRRALVNRGYKVRISTDPPDPDEHVDAVLVSFPHLLRQDIPGYRAMRNRVYVGIRSHSSLRNLNDDEREIMNDCAACWAVNKRLTAEAEEALPDASVFYLPDGIDVARYRPDDDRVYPVDWFVAGWSGNAGLPEKQYRVAVEACAAAGVELLAVGRGEGLRLLPVGSMPAFFHDVTVYLCSSIEDGGPNGPLEAAACGVPTISTPCGAMPEFITHGTTGWLADRPYQMADCLHELKREIWDTGWRNSKVARASHFARLRAEKWSWDNQICGFLEMMQ